MKQLHSCKKKIVLASILALCIQTVPMHANLSFQDINIKHIAAATVAGVITIATPITAYLFGKSKGSANSKHALEAKKLENENNEKQRKHEEMLARNKRFADAEKRKSEQEQKEKENRIKTTRQQNRAYSNITIAKEEYSTLLNNTSITSQDIEALARTKNNDYAKGPELNLHEDITAKIQLIHNNIPLLKTNKDKKNAINIIHKLERLRGQIPKDKILEQEALYQQEMHDRKMKEEERKQAAEKTKLIAAERMVAEQKYTKQVKETNVLTSAKKAIKNIEEKAATGIDNVVKTGKTTFNSLYENVATQSDIDALRKQATLTADEIKSTIEKSEKAITDDTGAHWQQWSNHNKLNQEKLTNIEKQTKKIENDINDLYEYEEEESGQSSDTKGP